VAALKTPENSGSKRGAGPASHGGLWSPPPSALSRQDPVRPDGQLRDQCLDRDIGVAEFVRFRGNCRIGAGATSDISRRRSRIGARSRAKSAAVGRGARAGAGVAWLAGMRSIATLVGAILMGSLAIGCGSTSSHASEGGADTGGAGGPCSACTRAGGGFEACPSDVASAASCPSPGRACCAGAGQWHCGNCIAETCHWFQSCTPADFDAGGHCNDSVSCPSDQICVAGGTCAVTCQLDAGTCTAGTSCGTATWYFNPVLVDVCH
jgi:hypothetical protein